MKEVRKATVERARELRSGHSGAEKLFWTKARNRQLNGWKIRRQSPLGPYIVDFYIDELKAVIELDGDQHGETFHSLRDVARDKWLEMNGYCVLRIWNRDLFGDVDGTLDMVCGWLDGLKDEKH